MTISKDNIIHLLKEHGLKVTQQRLILLCALKNTKSHPTAEELFDLLKEDNPTLSLGTVYKNLETLVDNKLINKVMTKKGKMRYDADLQSHHHIYINNTGEIVDYHDEELNELISNYFRDKKISNLKIDNISVNINGIKI